MATMTKTKAAEVTAIVGELNEFATGLRNQVDRLEELKALAVGLREQRDARLDDVAEANANNDYVGTTTARNDATKLQRKLELITSMSEHLRRLGDAAGGLVTASRNFQRGQ